jgi:hypothetical protein
MESDESISAKHIKHLNDPSSIDRKSKIYAGKTIQDIRYYGNGEEIITFTDGTNLCYSVGHPESGDDLYSKTIEEFNFDTWKYYEQEYDEGKTCKKCGSRINIVGYCSDETCPYSSHRQNETYTEG